MVSWQPAHSGKLCIRSWDDDDFNIVFDAISGDTHLLDDLSLRLLELINQHGLPTTTLADQVSDFFTGGSRSELLEFVEATLLQLQATGLITHSAP